MYVYCVPTNEILGCAVMKQTPEGQLTPLTASAVLLPLAQSYLRIDKSEIELLTPQGKVVDPSAELLPYCVNQVDCSLTELFLC